MKKIIIRTAAILLVGLTLSYLAICTATFNFSKPIGSETTLLETNWQQMGGFNHLTPQQERTGCWSTAFAQIFYFHQLQPQGEVEYQCSNGQVMKNDLGDHQFNWSQFAKELTDSTPEVMHRETAQFNYFTALAVQKDFGTGSYVQGEYGYFNLEQLRRLYPAAFRFYPCVNRKYPYTPSKMEHVIATEIEAKRPLFFYFMNEGDFGHATAIDGFQRKDGQFLVHINQGQGGQDDGWYDFHGPILRDDDWKNRVLITVKPYGIQEISAKF